ncbi:MAG TPA: hypothetical protein ENF28_08065 [Proteobacteria bacterium]|nr:hypothetical protein [Pseudomonadota bacterium]
MLTNNSVNPHKKNILIQFYQPPNLSTLLLKACHSFQYPLEGYKKQEIVGNTFTDVRAWLIAVLAAELITRCDSRRTPRSRPWTAGENE